VALSARMSLPASRASGPMTGQTLDLDGGLTL
jgi:hypothetical protein